MTRLRSVAAWVCSVGLAVGLAACGDSASETEPSASAGAGTAASASYNTPLKGICPDTVVVQTSWWPEVDYGATYQLLGANPKIDEGRFRVSGPLGATGVNLEIRSGGPAVSFDSTSALFEKDDDILLGYLDLDEVIRNSAEHPSVGVLAPYAKTPLMFFWGDQSSDFRTLADIGRSGRTVLVGDEAYLNALVGEGLFQRSQIDNSYDGDLRRFVAEDGKLVQVGFVTDEPYRLEHDVAEWAKPVKYLMVGDEYPAYANVLGIRKDKLAENRECLSKLVPLFQRAMVDYLADPKPANDLMIEVTSRLDTAGYELSSGLLSDGNTKQRELGLVRNGADGVYGTFDTARVQQLITRLTPGLAEAGTPPAAGLKPADVVTDEFIDTGISLN
ncbi:hypothetical protein ACG83_18020 [Frankia sp. R43]|uniref:hypothetical protein n=1 Tax=Frankia sp. R43 TaxID=269536 RepID=UPI0006DA5216|nr:hypothetical protein [Frankia sp. R43]KPM53977.1 hypothetical protein ACG83_18020 [Frankia sp. R43]